MTSMTGTRHASTLGGRLAALEAERLAPVPRASHAVAVDAGDLAAVLDHIRTDASAGIRTDASAGIGAGTAAAYERLTQAARGHAALSPARQGRQEMHWDAVALPDGQMLATAAARLLGRLSALAAQGDGRPAGATCRPPGRQGRRPHLDQGRSPAAVRGHRRQARGRTKGCPVTGQKYVHIDRVHPHPGNIRADLGDLTETAASMRAHGVLQPIIVQPHPQISGAYQVLAGHRRLAAARLAGRDQVPVVVRQPPPGVAPEELMLVENCHRRDLSPMDKAEAMGALRARGYAVTRIARSIGMAESTVSFYLTLLDLAPAAQAKVRSGELSAADAVAAVRRVRQRQRARDGKPVAGGGEWEPDHFTTAHPLAKKARAMCEAREHSMRRRVGKIACGQCWETVIRADERTVTATLAGGSLPLRSVS